MIVSVASGKGGTGKTTVAVSMAIAAAPVTLIDADVEEPNANILLRAPKRDVTDFSVPFPIVDPLRCDYCEKCAEFCAYNAMIVLKGLKVFAAPEICKSCGGCILVCPQDAISEKPRKMGLINYYSRLNVNLIEGEINVGEAVAKPLINELFRRLPEGNDVIVDCPPGSAHSVVESTRSADFVVLVTEPTPFGLHDLIEALKVTDSLKKPVGIIINRSDIGDNKIEILSEEENIPILMKIPYSSEIARKYSQGIPPAEFSDYWREEFIKLWHNIMEIVE